MNSNTTLANARQEKENVTNHVKYQTQCDSISLDWTNVNLFIYGATFFFLKKILHEIINFSSYTCTFNFVIKNDKENKNQNRCF